MEPSSRLDLLQRIEEKRASLVELTDEVYNNAARLEAVINLCSNGIVVMDILGRILSVNDAFCALMGYSQEEFADEKLDFLTIASPMSDVFRNYIREYLENERYITYDRKIIHKDGRVLRFEFTCTAIKDVEKSTIGYAGIVRDRNSHAC